MTESKPANFEDALSRLQEIVTELENGKRSLEEGIALYKEGACCARFCREQLDKAKHEISVWQAGESKPFADMNCAEMLNNDVNSSREQGA